MESTVNNAFSSSHPNPEVITALIGLSASCTRTTDQWGNVFVWATLHNKEDLPKTAKVLRNYKARLCTVTALAHAVLSDARLFLDYHFDIDGAVFSIVVPLENDNNSVPSITTWFRNADWNERECAELYSLTFEGNNNPDRLFLDESIEEGILRESIPLSTMMNGTCTSDMWEHITAMNLSAAPHSVFPEPDGPAEPWPPLVDPSLHQEMAHPFPSEAKSGRK